MIWSFHSRSSRWFTCCFKLLVLPFGRGRRTSAFHNLPKPGFTPSGFSSSQACCMSIRYSPTILIVTKKPSAHHCKAPWNASPVSSDYKDKLIYSIDSIDPELHLSLFKVAWVVFLIPHRRKVAGHNSCLCGANCLRRQQGWA